MPTTDLTELDDDALVARAIAGDASAFGELVRRHQTAALRVAAIVSGSTEEAADIVQDAFVSIHRALPDHRGEGTVRSWMLRIVANHAKNHVRSRTRRLRRDDRHASLQIRAVADDRVDAGDLAIDRVEHERLAVALAALKSDDRSVLGCRFVADLSEADTAAVLGIPIGTVKSRTSRALERLRAQLGEEDGS